MTRDITGRKKVEDELKKSEERWRALTTNSNDVIMIVDDKGVIQDINRTVSPYTPEETIGKEVYEYVSREQRNLIRESLRKVFKTKKSDIYEISSNIPKIGVSWFSTEVIPIIHDENVDHVIMISKDITERKKIDEVLHASVKRYMSYIEVTGQLGWTTNADGEVEEDIPSWRKYTGQSYEEIKGRGWTKAVHPDDFEHTMQVWKKAVVTKSTYEVEYHVRRHDGVYRYFMARSVPVLKEDGSIQEWVGTCIDITDRKQTENALQESEKKYRQLVEFLHEGIWAIDKDSITTFVNPRMAEMLGYTINEMVGRHLFSFMDEHGVEVAKQFLEQRRQGVKEQYYSELIKKDGGRIYVVLETSPITDANGNYNGGLAGIMDLTEHKQMEEELQAREEMFRTIFEGATDGILIADPETKKFYMGNGRICKMLGYGQEELKDIGVMDIHPKEDLAHVLEEFEKQRNRETEIATDLPVIRKDGSVFYANVNSAPIRIAGKMYQMGIFRDVTAQKITEEKLRLSESMHRGLIDNASDLIFVINEKYEIISINPAAAKLFGRTTEMVLGKSIIDVFPKEIAEQFVKNVREVLQTARRSITDEKIVLAERELWISTRLEPLVDDAGRTYAICGIARDITEHKNTEKALAEVNSSLKKQLRETTHLQNKLKNTNQLLSQSNVDLENYTYVVSHDLKAPLRAIRSFSIFLLEDYAKKIDETGKDYLRRIADASSHMDTLIGELLLLSRVGRKFMEVEVVDLNQLLKEIVADLEPSIQKHSGEVIFTGLPTVPIQRTWMKELFMNLLDNGLKFNKSKTPRVEVTCEEKETEFLFKVRDNGIGIKEKYFGRLFNLFERLHSQEEYEGTGAGLAICKRIIQQFGGKIWVESQEDKGSTFSFTLPKSKKLITRGG